MRAIYQMDEPHPIVGFFLRAVYRFRVSQRPELKSVLNKKTMHEAISYLKKGGTLMTFPEGYCHWERKLHPGMAIIAHKANVPLVPVGIENGYAFRPDLFPEPPLQAMKRVIKDYRLLKHVTLHFADPIYPNDRLDTEDDVNRIGGLIETRFNEFYRRFYNTSGPVWQEQARDSAPRS